MGQVRVFRKARKSLIQLALSITHNAPTYRLCTGMSFRQTEKNADCIRKGMWVIWSKSSGENNCGYVIATPLFDIPFRIPVSICCYQCLKWSVTLYISLKCVNYPARYPGRNLQKWRKARRSNAIGFEFSCNIKLSLRSSLRFNWLTDNSSALKWLWKIIHPL